MVNDILESIKYLGQWEINPSRTILTIIITKIPTIVIIVKINITSSYITYFGEYKT